MHYLNQYGLITDTMYADILETSDIQLQIIIKVQNQFGQTIELNTDNDPLFRTPEPKNNESTETDKS